MDNNRSVSVKKKAVMKNIITAIMVILMCGIVFCTFLLVGAGVRYINAFISDAGTIDFGIANIVYSSTAETIQAICLCALDLAATALIIVCFAFLWSFFNEIVSKNKPFIPGQGTRLQRIAILMMIGALLSSFYTTWALTLSAEPMHIAVLIWTFVTSLGVGLFYPLVFFCMALIFNYGLGLQTESDETL